MQTVSQNEGVYYKPPAKALHTPEFQEALDTGRVALPPPIFVNGQRSTEYTDYRGPIIREGDPIMLETPNKLLNPPHMPYQEGACSFPNCMEYNWRMRDEGADNQKYLEEEYVFGGIALYGESVGSPARKITMVRQGTANFIASADIDYRPGNCPHMYWIWAKSPVINEEKQLVPNKFVGQNTGLYNIQKEGLVLHVQEDEFRQVLEAQMAQIDEANRAKFVLAYKLRHYEGDIQLGAQKGFLGTLNVR